ncbi:MAG: anthranilate synthase component I [Desulfuromonadaceae bacterium]|nr:anthranilate synthase component I [Desulfuromonadaceae bacterium]
MQIFPSLDEFKQLACLGNIVPVYTELLADLETPVSAFMKIKQDKWAYLLESVEGGEKWGRYSILGSGDANVFRSRGEYFEFLRNDAVYKSGTCPDPLGELETLFARYVPVVNTVLPRFFGGAVGYCSYDMVRFFEKLPDLKPAVHNAWDSCFIFSDTLLIFDNKEHKIKIIHNVHLHGADDLDSSYAAACEQIESMTRLLRAPLQYKPPAPPIADTDLQANFTRQTFEAAVRKAKEYVCNGDVIQVVLSQCFSGEADVDPLDIYRSLRTINPSPYMFYLCMDTTVVVGASPEVLVRKDGSRVDVRPIAGTRRRGATPQEDSELERELLADPKEVAEHIMLVDLGRNDLGRICRIGSVEVGTFKHIERYSHVMHIVSNVSGELRPEINAFDTLRATFPAGTLSGAPKIRAMEIIDELEPQRRGIYGGAVGYFSYTGNMDMAIAIRTLLIQDGKIFLQAGAGIVADSDPSAEYDETINKARGVMLAIRMARRGLI